MAASKNQLNHLARRRFPVTRAPSFGLASGPTPMKVPQRQSGFFPILRAIRGLHAG
jgi:hypothetical protein